MQIIHKTINPGFDPAAYLRILEQNPGEFSRDKLLFYDIETTGLTAGRDAVYLVGFVFADGEMWEYMGLFAESPEEESDVLSRFAEIRSRYSVFVSFNGSSFDSKFLKKRCEKYGISLSNNGPELDLLREFKDLKSLLSLPAMKQKNLESFLGSDRTFPEGREGIRLYKAYLLDHDPIKFQMLTGHNEEDLSGLIMITQMASYLQLYRGMYRTVSAELAASGELVIQIQTEIPFPAGFSFENERVSLAADADIVKISVLTKEGKTRIYYPDYKNYDYIPSEDTAMPKSISQFLDRSLRKAAKRETCYTWFRADECFLGDFDSVDKYLRQSLGSLLQN